MSDKLRDPVGSSVGSDQRTRGVPTKERGEVPCRFLRLQRLPGPDAWAIMVLSEAMVVGPTLVDANFRLKSSKGFQVVIDGDRGQLNDGVFLWVEAARFDV